MILIVHFSDGYAINVVCNVNSIA